MKQIFKDTDGNEIFPIDAIFPIIKNHQGKTSFVGTGFFINPVGGFLTARHVLPANSDELSSYFAVQTVEGEHHFIRKIQIFFPHPTADIGIGILHGKLMQYGIEKFRSPLSISLDELKIKDDVKTFAFPETTLDSVAEEQILNVKGTWKEGKIIEYLPHRPMFNGPCYMTSINVESGASGGPVLSNGLVVGVNSSGYDL